MMCEYEYLMKENEETNETNKKISKKNKQRYQNYMRIENGESMFEEREEK